MLLPGVYLTHTGRPDDAAREMAALLYAGPQSVLTGVAALRRHGLSASQPGGAAGEQFRHGGCLGTAGSRRADVAFARLHRTRRLPRGFCVAGEVRFALPPRAVADAVRPMTDLADVRALVAEAVQRRQVLDPAPGRGACRRAGQWLGPAPPGTGRGRGGSPVRCGGRPARPDPVGSPADAAVQPAAARGREFLAMPDCWWPESGVAGEADSRAWHFSPREWEQTLARHARMSAHGIIVLHSLRSGSAPSAARWPTRSAGRSPPAANYRKSGQYLRIRVDARWPSRPPSVIVVGRAQPPTKECGWCANDHKRSGRRRASREGLAGRRGRGG